MARKNQVPATRRKRPGAKGRSTRIAAVDLGTNNCRLLIAEQSGDGFRVLDSYSRIVRLGEGLNATGALSDGAKERALEALHNCQQKIQRMRADKVRCITTQACRAASNGQEFIRKVRQETGLRLETISPKEEAKLALLGSLDLIDTSGEFALVVDIGGGSTELSWVDANAVQRRGVDGCAVRPPILGWASFPVGVVTLSEAFPESGTDWYPKLVEYVAGMLRENVAAERFAHLFEKGRGYMVGTSGTVTSLTAVHLDLPKYVRTQVDGQWLTRDQVVAARDKLRFASPQERASNPCIGPDRADLVLAGCAILDAVWSVWPSKRLRAGDRGLREGVLLSLIHKPKKKPQKNKPQVDTKNQQGVSAAE